MTTTDLNERTLPPHGTRRRQRLGCSCHPCRKVHADYQARTRRLKAYGKWQPFTDAQPVRDHLRWLSSHGIGWKRVAELTGIPKATVNHIAYGRPGRLPARCRTTTAQTILALQPTLDTVSAAALWPAVGTVRRLRALVAIGWPMAHLAQRLPVNPDWGQRIISVGPDTLTADTARAARDLYEQLHMTLAPDTWVNARARRYAARRGWVPPLAWDDDTIDDPDAQPNLGGDCHDVDEVLVDYVLRGLHGRHFGDLNPAEQVALAGAWLRWRRHQRLEGPGTAEFGRRFGLSHGTAYRLIAAGRGLNTRGNPIRDVAAAAA